MILSDGASWSYSFVLSLAFLFLKPFSFFPLSNNTLTHYFLPCCIYINRNAKERGACKRNQPSSMYHLFESMQAHPKRYDWSWTIFLRRDLRISFFNEKLLHHADPVFPHIYTQSQKALNVEILDLNPFKWNLSLISQAGLRYNYYGDLALLDLTSYMEKESLCRFTSR